MATNQMPGTEIQATIPRRAAKQAGEDMVPGGRAHR